MDLIKYVILQAHVSGPTNLWNTDVWKSFSKYPTGPIYDPIMYNDKIGPAIIFYKNLLARRQRVLMVSAMEEHLRISGPFSHLFLTSAWVGGALTNYRKVQLKLRHAGVFLDLIKYLESTLFYNNISFQWLIENIILKEHQYMEHKLLNLHELSIKNLIFINNSLSQQWLTDKELVLGFSYLNISKNITNVLWLHKSIYKGLEDYIIHVILYQLLFIFLQRLSGLLTSFQLDNKYDGDINRVVTSEYFIRKPIVLHKSIIYPFLYNVINPNSKIGMRFLITLFRNFYKGRGHQITRIKQMRFPAINIALDLSLANMYVLNESRHLYLPIISFHKSIDPARGPVYSIPAHIGTPRQIAAYGYFFLGLILKQQTLDLQQLYSWDKLQQS